MATNEFNIVFCFDTTGSMSGCIGQVRNKIKEVIGELFMNIPGINIGLVAFGDYCDEKTSYLMKSIDITKNQSDLIKFVENTGNTGGGDFPEAYEYVLREIQKLSWTSNSMRALVVIGDAIPHEPKDNPYKIDWRHEIKEIASLGINIYSVQCLNSGSPSVKTFFKQMAMVTNGYHLYLDQFKYIVEMMKAICYKQMGTETLENYEQKLKENLGSDCKSLKHVFDVMLNRITTEEIEEENEKKYDFAPRTTRVARSKVVDLSSIDPEKLDEMKPCAPARFQILDVEEKCSIKDFVQKNSLVFKAGKGFYEFTKPETISEKKEIILLSKTDGLLYEGLKARKMLNLISYDSSKKIKPTDFPDYTVFIQSTSYNRQLVGDTKFLYDSEE